MPDITDALLAPFAGALADPAIITNVELRVLAQNAAVRDVAPHIRHGGALALGIRAPEILLAARRVADGGEAEQVMWNEPSPTVRVFDVRVSPLVLGTERNILLVLRDISESRRVERMRTDFIANASHELRTPLASMLGFVETLQGPARDDAAARDRFLRVMAEQGRRMARLIDDLLSLSRIEQNLYIRPTTRVELSQIVRYVCDTLAPVALENRVGIVQDVDNGALVYGDRDELIRMAENLIENAIKYCAREDGGSATVEVAVKGEADSWCFSVRDNGPGIAAEHLTRLTERFYRVDTATSRAKGGTGLGLAIVKHIVARHRGKLSIESRVGEGSLFTILLERAA